MRKLLSLVLASMLLIGLLAIPAMAEDVEVKVYNLKVEINEAITNFAKRYSEATDGVTVTVETLGGGADYGGGLKAKLASDSMPDIFMIEGRGGYDLWKDYLLDMGDTDWVKDTELYYAPEGTIVGFPIGIEGFGL
ncbi:MAG: extracellular solute-binding protein, partial [Clostridiales bacterium]|nr:extracellular solute-binding protein [Clostridiales bacterium]